MNPPKIDNIAAAKQSTTKSCVYFMVYIVLSLIAENILMVLSCYHNVKTYGSGHETAAVLLPGFTISW